MNKRFMLPLAFLPIVFGSCNHYYYAPNMHNSPMFREKGEVRLAVSSVTSDEMGGADFQAAGSVTDHIGVMVNGTSVRGNSNDQFDNGRGHLFEAGVGYFGVLENKWVYEVYGGYGRGTVENNYQAGVSSKMDLSRFFVQPAIGFTHNVINFGISMRIAALSFSNIDSIGLNPLDYPDNSREVGYIMNNPTSILMEPAVHFRVGYKYAKFITQLSFSNNLTNPDLQQAHVVFGAGLQFHFARYFQDANTRRP